MDSASPWRIVWEPDGSRGRATHTSGLKLLISRNGWATVTECPPQVNEIEATVLMAELQRLLTDEEAHED